MGHTVLIVTGLTITFEGDPENVEAEFENLLNRLKKFVDASSYFSSYSGADYYLLQGREGYDTTNKAYLFPASSIIWSTQCDGSAGGYFHEGDGLESIESWIEKLISAKEDAQTKLTDLCGKLGIPVSNVDVIRYSATYE